MDDYIICNPYCLSLKENVVKQDYVTIKEIILEHTTDCFLSIRERYDLTLWSHCSISLIGLEHGELLSPQALALIRQLFTGSFAKWTQRQLINTTGQLWLDNGQQATEAECCRAG